MQKLKCECQHGYVFRIHSLRSLWSFMLYYELVSVSSLTLSGSRFVVTPWWAEHTKLSRETTGNSDYWWHLQPHSACLWDRTHLRLHNATVLHNMYPVHVSVRWDVCTAEHVYFWNPMWNRRCMIKSCSQDSVVNSFHGIFKALYEKTEQSHSIINQRLVDWSIVRKWIAIYFDKRLFCVILRRKC